MGFVFVVLGAASVHPSLLLAGIGAAWWRLGLYLFTGFMVVVFSVYDIKYMEIPVGLLTKTIIILVALLFIDSLFPQSILFSHYYLSVNSIVNIPIVNAAWGAGLIYAFFQAQIYVSQGRWLGGGDVYIGVFMGLIGGLKIGILGLFLGYVIGGVFGIILMILGKSSKMEIPFGPFLGAGLLAALLFSDFFVPFFPVFAL